MLFLLFLQGACLVWLSIWEAGEFSALYYKEGEVFAWSQPKCMD